MESIAPVAIPRPRAESAAMPWYLMTMLLGSTGIAVGILWDLSWHLSIGRDTFWSPPHVAVYFGGVLAGLSCGALALRTTFARRRQPVRHASRMTTAPPAQIARSRIGNRAAIL